MTVESLLKILEENVAPLKVSNDFCARYKMYDNSGIIINCGKKIDGVLFTLDLSLESVKRAKEAGFNAIVTHHPAIFGGITSFDLTDNAQAKALGECIADGISVISMHLNFDAAPQGIDYFLMKGLGGVNAETLDKVEGGAYGRCYGVPAQTFRDYIEKVKDAFKTSRLLSYGDNERMVKRVASFCGSGCDDNAIAFAKSNEVDVFVSSDMKHHKIAELVESGINVVQLTHYCAETYGFSEIYNKIKQIMDIPSSYFVDERFM